MQNHHSFITKKPGFFLALALFIAALAPGSEAAAPSASAKPSASAAPAKTMALNQKEIHAAYNEGDFDKVTNLIDAFNKANKGYSRADSIFIAKHLAVVYSANPQSREKGKYYMYRLLEMMPSAELVDMFVSDEIDRIFDKVRKEFLTRQKAFGVDSSQISMPAKPAGSSGQYGSASAAGKAGAKPAVEKTGPSSEYLAAGKEEKQPYWKRNGFWIAGGIGLIVAGTAAVYIYSQQDEPAGKTIVIPGEASAQN